MLHAEAGPGISFGTLQDHFRGRLPHVPELGRNTLEGSGDRTSRGTLKGVTGGGGRLGTMTT